ALADATPEGARICAKTALALAELADRYSDDNSRERLTVDARNYWRRAVEYSEESALLELLFLLGPDSPSILGYGYGTDETLEIFKKFLKHAEETKDRLLCGW